MPTTVYLSSRCPSCDRLYRTIRRIGLGVTVVNIDDGRTIEGLTAVPTVVADGQVFVGTKAFEWVQGYEANVPLDAYATVLGQGDCDGLSYTDLESGDTVDATQFSYL